jgi:3-carboxy-cis,cis-muconate cycloisomerase
MMSPSSWRSDPGPFAYLVARGDVAAASSERAWLQAMLDVEAALAAAQASVGEISAGVAAAIAEGCDVERLDIDALHRATELGGIAVIGLVEQLRSIVGGESAGHVHRGATSQDVLDTAAMSVAARCAALTAAMLDDSSSIVAALSAQHGDTAMIGRTLGQWALPTTFAAVTGRWQRALDGAAAALNDAASGLPVQLGGPVGDGASYGPRAGEITAAVAARLGLAVPDGPWSTERAPIASIAGAWSRAATAVGDVSTQLLALMASDVGELAERAEGAGGSSSMVHKHNPAAAIAARAAALQVPGLVATLLHGAASHDFERASGPWHAEWPALNGLLRACGSAADWLATSLRRVVVDPERMAANLARANAERGGG